MTGRAAGPWFGRFGCAILPPDPDPRPAPAGCGSHVVRDNRRMTPQERYDELVPVLVCDGVELSRYRLDAERVRSALASHGA